MSSFMAMTSSTKFYDVAQIIFITRICTVPRVVLLRRTLPRKDNSPTGHLPDGHFPDQIFPL